MYLTESEVRAIVRQEIREQFENLMDQLERTQAILKLNAEGVRISPEKTKELEALPRDMFNSEYHLIRKNYSREDGNRSFSPVVGGEYAPVDPQTIKRMVIQAQEQGKKFSDVYRKAR